MPTPAPALEVDPAYLAAIKSHGGKPPSPCNLPYLKAMTAACAKIDADRSETMRAKWRASSQAERNAMAEAEGRELRAYVRVAALSPDERAEHAKAKDREKKQRYRAKRRECQ